MWAPKNKVTGWRRRPGRRSTGVRLELAKSAGDKELSDKLLKFISSYDSGQEALLSNNGTVAIKEFTKALSLDEQLSSGWGKYGSEIRKHLDETLPLYARAKGLSVDSLPPYKSNWGDPIP